MSDVWYGTHKQCISKIAALKTENKRLRDTLRYIGLGKQPMDYGMDRVCWERLAGTAQAALAEDDLARDIG